MTVMYTDKVADATFGGFLKLLLRWRGSVYKLIWKELLIYLVIYYILSMVYRFALNEDHRRVFEQTVNYCNTYQDAINLTFVLGFYVGVVFTRWKDQYTHIPWPDSACIVTNAYLLGDDDRSRLMRRTVIRYVNLSYVLSMRTLSPPVKKRFPTMSHLVTAGLMLANELKILDGIDTPYNKYPIPIIWASNILLRARKEGRIVNELAVCHISYEINQFRRNLARLFLVDFCSIPIVYTQVVTLCTYIYFAFSLLSQQFVVISSNLSKPDVDLYVPIAPILQFLFYMGWLKVAEVIINPFDEEDDDFDINAYIDRNWTFSYLLVDEMHLQHPELTRDAYWDHVEFELPYTVANNVRTADQVQLVMASADAVVIPKELTEFRRPSTDADQEDVKQRRRSVELKSRPYYTSVASEMRFRNLNETGLIQNSATVRVISIRDVTLRRRSFNRQVEYDSKKLGAFAPEFKTRHHYKTPFDNRFEENNGARSANPETGYRLPRRSHKRASVAPVVKVSAVSTTTATHPTESDVSTTDHEKTQKTDDDTVSGDDHSIK